MAIQSPQDMLTYALGDMYDAEQRFLQGMQEMLGKASNPQLKQGIQTHIQQTQGQIQNLQQIGSILNMSIPQMTCNTAASLVSEAQQEVSQAGSNGIRDSLIDGALDKVEHFEIASYRSIIAGAQQMGQQQVISLLQQNLQQEEQTSQKLEQLAPQLAQNASGGAGAQNMSQGMGSASATGSNATRTQNTQGGQSQLDPNVTVDTSSASDILVVDDGQNAQTQGNTNY